MSLHTLNSSYREKLIEHLLVGELLKLSWKGGDCELEIAKPEVDNAGYDLIAEQNGFVRHIQLKASHTKAKTSRQRIHVRLGTKPSGCVVWVSFDEETLELGPFYFFGSKPGLPLPSLENARVARHTKGNRDGFKADRPNLRELNKGQFVCLDKIELLYEQLFGNRSS